MALCVLFSTIGFVQREPLYKQGVTMRQSVLVSVAVLGSVVSASAVLAQAPPRTNIPADADTLITAAQFQDILKSGPVANGKPANLSTQLFGRVGNAAFIRIVAADTPHAHAGTSEIYVIQSGKASIETGGEMVGPFNGNSAVHQDAFVNADGSRRAPGTGPGPGASAAPALRPAAADAAAAAGNGGGQGGGRGAAGPGGPHDGSGTAVAGGRIQEVKAGDVILVPAGVPHHWVKVDEPVVYLDIKYPKPKE
jgi:mannose-6-phosphate isomerase-like protein (cupin superfamily)